MRSDIVNDLTFLSQPHESSVLGRVEQRSIKAGLEVRPAKASYYTFSQKSSPRQFAVHIRYKRLNIQHLIEEYKNA